MGITRRSDILNDVQFSLSIDDPKMDGSETFALHYRWYKKDTTELEYANTWYLNRKQVIALKRLLEDIGE